MTPPVPGYRVKEATRNSLPIIPFTGACLSVFPWHALQWNMLLLQLMVRINLIQEETFNGILSLGGTVFSVVGVA